MNKIFKITALMMGLLFVLVGCGNKLETMNEKFDEFKELSKNNPYMITTEYAENQGTILDYVSDTEYSITYSSLDKVEKFVCKNSELERYELNGKEQEYSPILEEEYLIEEESIDSSEIIAEEYDICSMSIYNENIDGVIDFFEMLDIFNGKYEVEKDGDYYEAEVEEYEVKVHKSGKIIEIESEFFDLKAQIK